MITTIYWHKWQSWENKDTLHYPSHYITSLLAISPHNFVQLCHLHCHPQILQALSMSPYHLKIIFLLKCVSSKMQSFLKKRRSLRFLCDVILTVLQTVRKKKGGDSFKTSVLHKSIF